MFRRLVAVLVIVFLALPVGNAQETEGPPSDDDHLLHVKAGAQPHGTEGERQMGQKCSADLVALQTGMDRSVETETAPKHLGAPWEPGRCPAPKEAWSWSQGGEDQDLYNFFFCGAKNKTYVEMGALDGERFSNTMFFDRFMGWAGALIEPTPTSAAMLRKNRPNPRNAIFAEGVCAKDVGHLDLWVGDEPAKNHLGERPGEEAKIVQVPCRPLGTILREMLKHTGSDHIDLFSLDVEQQEFEVLQTMDWDIPVRVWLIEVFGSAENITQLLNSHGYVRSERSLPKERMNEYDPEKHFRDARNAVFVHR